MPYETGVEHQIYNMRFSLCTILATSSVVVNAALNGEEFWTREKGGKTQACFHEGNDWYYCTAALPGSWRDYPYALAIGDGYYVELNADGKGLVNIFSDNGW
ncbi:unnamed protein product [Periconia digitata]|uniref:Uncharacterized protein n=1 Tax=Periconia digitata TaxID=1303443 RepID=A0A9W4XSR7_9PLEO|nr:unnamed protein product [Periconia digitata]